jgi:hypothetical protein
MEEKVKFCDLVSWLLSEMATRLSAYQKHMPTRLAEDSRCSTDMIHCLSEKHHL